MAGGKALRAGYKPFFRAAPIDPDYPEKQTRTLVNTLPKFKEFALRLLTGGFKAISIDTETSDLDSEVGELVGASFAVSFTESYYLPVAHKIGQNLPLNLLLEIIAEVNKRVDIIYFWNTKFDLRFLRAAGIEEYVSVNKIKSFDVAVIAFNTDTNIGMPDLKSTCLHYLGWQMRTYSEVAGDHDDFSYIDPEECYEYPCDDALGTLYLPFKLANTFQEAKAVNRLDNKVNIALMHMEDDAVHINLERVEQLKEEVDQRLVDLETSIYKQAGCQFKINSPKVLAEVLGNMGLYTGKYTDKGNVSTKEEYLQAISSQHPVIAEIIDYKKALKMNSSYLEPLEKFYRRELDGCRFAYFSAAVPTGRLAAGGDKKNSYYAKMNVQAITKANPCYYKAEKMDSENSVMGYSFTPTKDKTAVEGFELKGNLRTAFEAPEGYYWVHIDYSAQELRIPANMSKEPVLLDVFINGSDFHKIMAEKIFGYHDAEIRKKIKPVNFGALFGGNEWTFSRELGIPLVEAEEIILAWWANLPVLKKWVDAIHRKARRDGVVYTYFGRPRRLRHWYSSKNFGMMNFADRSAVSHTVQGTGGDIMRYDIVTIYAKLSDWIKNRIMIPKITVHDELNFYVRKDKATEVILTLKDLMEIKISEWPAPMDVGIAIGKSWGEIYEFHLEGDKFLPG